MHESECHEANCFITLTYADENLPEHNSLSKRDLQLFWKSLRQKISPVKIKYFAAGEYGDPEKGSRLFNPHYHAAVFGYGFPDKYKVGRKNGHDIYESQILNGAWQFGGATIAELTFESAQYICGYVTKKINGEKAAAHYGKRIPEFGTMSRGGRRKGRGGIGSSWLDRHFGDVYPSDEVIVKGKSCKPPRYYDVALENESPLLAELVSLGREYRQTTSSETVTVGERRFEVNPGDNKPRLQVREKYAKAKQELYK